MIWGIIKIFRRNKEHKDNIKALSKLAINQDKVVNELKEQVDQLQKQTSLFEYQTNLMLDSNKIMERQLDLQIQMFENTQNIEEQKISIEKQKRINEIKPYFVYSSGSSAAQYATIKFLNKGGNAHSLTIEPINNENVFFQRSKTKSLVEKNKSYEVKVQFKNPYSLSLTSHDFSFKLKFNDMDQNIYEQVVEMVNRKLKVNHPVIKK